MTMPCLFVRKNGLKKPNFFSTPYLKSSVRYPDAGDDLDLDLLHSFSILLQVINLARPYTTAYDIFLC